MRVETPCNILISFAYINNDIAKLVADEVSAGRVNLMLDSGAFTAFKTGKKIELDNYIAFLKDFGQIAEKYVTLDVIGHRDKTVENYERMVAAGLAPMFTLGSISAYWVSQSWDVFIFHKLRDKWNAKQSRRWLWNNISTGTSQIFDTVVP